MTESLCKLLLVDDEPALLDALRRTHRKRYRISVATNGAAGLDALEREGPFDVVVSDYQMPEMNGVDFLAQVALRAPEAMRLMLTGNADLKTAIDAVNTGEVFRFLTKPCSPEVFAAGVDAAMEQVRLRRAERELLEGTLKGSIQVLSEVLSLCNPEAFGRAIRVRGYVAELASLLELADPWRVESAAFLSQIGCVALPGDILQRTAAGQELSPEQLAAYERHPEIGARLLDRIPRLEAVAAMVARQRWPASRVAKERSLTPAVLRGCHVLAACLEFDELVSLGADRRDALTAMAAREGAHPPEVLRAMEQIRPAGDGAVGRSIRLVELEEGMILAQEIRSKGGTMIVASGQRVSRSMIERLRNFHTLRGIAEPIHVRVSAPETKADAA